MILNSNLNELESFLCSINAHPKHKPLFLALAQNIYDGEIPLRWGERQNDVRDNQLPGLFSYASLSEVKRNCEINGLTNDEKTYFLRRWFMSKCAKCVEHLFSLFPEVTPNENHRDGNYDFIINNKHPFDLKSSVIPKEFRTTDSEIKDFILNKNYGDGKPHWNRLIDFHYEHQSTGVRNRIQNRLFLTYHSFIAPERELFLRTNWEMHYYIIKDYLSNITSKHPNFIKYNDVYADIIFFIEQKNGEITKKFCY